MKISFPQKLFSSPEKDDVKNGKQICKNSQILFCGIARDVGKTLDRNIKRIKFLCSYFKNSDIFIYENDSMDNTQNIIIENKINFKSENRNDKNYRQDIINGTDSNHYKRCKILADCRNKYIEYARTNCKSFDYICILDWDIRGFSYKGFFDSINILESSNEIASVSAYGILSDYNNLHSLESTKNNWMMYDSFAFRPLNFEGPLYPRIQAGFNFMYMPKKKIFVRSNFGGMCIYKNNALIQNNYDAIEIDGCVDADHVYINDKISSLGLKHSLNPLFIVSYSKHKFDND